MTTIRPVHDLRRLVPAWRYTQEEHPAIGDVDQASQGEHMDRPSHTSQDRHAGHSAEMFRRKFWGTLLLSIPTLASAPAVQRWFSQSRFRYTDALAMGSRGIWDTALYLWWFSIH